MNCGKPAQAYAASAGCQLGKGSNRRERIAQHFHNIELINFPSGMVARVKAGGRLNNRWRPGSVFGPMNCSSHMLERFGATLKVTQDRRSTANCFGFGT
jgi:hypothetical protein